MTKTPIKHTPEQEAIFAEAHSTSSLMIEAVAGSGKTYSLVHFANLAGGTGIAVAFNKSIALELAKKLPRRWDAATLNSVGHRAWSSFTGKRRLQLSTRKSFSILADLRCPQSHFAPALKLLALCKSYGVVHPKEPKKNTAKLFATNSFLADLADHYSIPIETPAFQYIRKALLASAVSAFKGKIDFDDQLYMPTLFHAPFPRTKTLLVDEFQDLSALQHEMLTRMLSPSGRIIAFGDRHQCHPPGTKVYRTGKGPVPIESLKVGQELATYNQRKTHSPGRKTQGRKIRHIHQSDFDGNLILIETWKASVKVTPEHRILTKMGNTKKYALYAMQKGNQCRIGVCRMTYDTHSGVTTRANQERADAAWLLQSYQTEEEATLYESLYSTHFGIPESIWLAPDTRHLKKSVTKAQTKLNTFWDLLGPNILRLEKLLEHFGKMIEYPIWKKGPGNPHAGKNKAFVIPACNLVDEMLVAIDIDNPEWLPIELTRIPYKGPVYGLEVQPNEHGTPLYWANNMCVHNSIYSFRGALSDSIPTAIARFHMKCLPLTVSFRCPQHIVECAQTEVPHIQAHKDAPKGLVTYAKFLTEATLPTIVLCRMNAPLFKLASVLTHASLSVHIKGRDIEKSLKSLLLKACPEKIPTRELRLALTRHIQEVLLHHPKREPYLIDAAESLLAIATNLESTSQIPARIEALFSEEHARFHLMTIHKSKGLEFPHILILSPSLIPSKFAKAEWELTQERNALYIAKTRSQSTLTFCELENIYIENTTCTQEKITIQTPQTLTSPENLTLTDLTF